MGTVDATVESRALAAVEVLSRFGVVRAAYLFGSHVEGTPDEWSDIDVAVFMEGIEQWDIHQHVAGMARPGHGKGGLRRGRASVSRLVLGQPTRGGFAQYILRHGIRIFEQQ